MSDDVPAARQPRDPDRWKVPPKAKVYEALSAIVDGRITLLEPTRAQVTSSTGDKAYIVEWSEDLTRITSNDNASHWQGYAGYPIVAVLLFLGRIPFDRTVAERLAGIPWKKLNRQYKNDYDKAVAAALQSILEAGGDSEEIAAMAGRIHERLQQLDLGKLGRRRRPPA